MQINSKFRIFGLIIGVLVLAGLVGVMALTVQRAQQLTSTITRPKATAVGWPECAKTGTAYNYDGPLSDLNCCSGVKNDPFACAWPQRGWCQPSQCPDTGGQHCSLYWYNSGSGCYYTANPGSCRNSSDCGAQEVCQNGSCQSTNPCWNPQPIPQNGKQTGDSLTWSWNTTYSSTVSYANVYVWAGSSRTGEALAVASADASSGYSSVKLSAFGSALQPSTAYFWKVNPNSYNSPDAAHQCMDAATSGWSFTTPVPATPHYGCVGKTCAVVSGATADANGCTAAGGTCCVGASDCATGQTCDTTKTPNSCLAAATHLECVSSACASVAGAGDNKDSCLTAGVSCCRSTVPLGDLLAPKLIAPIDASASASIGPTGGFAWQPQTGVCGTGISYTVYLGTSQSSLTAIDSCKDLTQTNNSSGQWIVCNPPSTTTTSGTKYYWKVTATKGSESKDSEVRSFTAATSNSESDVCWGNGGTGTNAGRCYDCNGDGTVNILDFSCFRLNWLKPVQ